ncbi:MAG: FAD-binding oxidoreductase, partial [Myxococcota bacterium]
MNEIDLSPLVDSLGADSVRTDDETKRTHGLDWTRYFAPSPAAVVFPRNTSQVQAIVGWARNARAALVPSGGRTGLSAAAVAASGEVVVSFDRMNAIGELDPDGQLIDAEPGVITEALQQHVAERGYFFPVDFASRGSSQIGGNIATNAGGIKVLRYGLIRDWVAGLEVVTGTGERLRLNNGLVKNATGYDLRHLMIGSEGTLGFITAATLKVTTPPNELSVVVLALENIESVMPVFHAFRRHCALTAFEFFSDACLKLVEDKGLSAPFESRPSTYVLAEVEHIGAEADGQIEQVFEQVMEAGHVVDGVISQSASQAKELWR